MLKCVLILTARFNDQVKADDLAGRVVGLQEEVRASRNEAAALRVELAVAKAEALLSTATSIGDSSTRYYSCSLVYPCALFLVRMSKVKTSLLL